jgi:cysteine desulfurase
MLKHRLILNGGKGSDVASGHILNISLKNDLGNWMNGDTVILALEREGILVSSGSACTSGALEPSHVIQAMCNDRHRAAASIRLSFNHHLPKNKLDTIVSAILKASKVIGDS